MARPDLHKGLFLRDSRHQTPNDLLPVQHRLSLPGKYSWIPVNILIIGYWPIVSQQKHARVGNSISVSMDCRSVRHVRFNGLETRIIVWTSFFFGEKERVGPIGFTRKLGHVSLYDPKEGKSIIKIRENIKSSFRPAGKHYGIEITKTDQTNCRQQQQRSRKNHWSWTLVSVAPFPTVLDCVNGFLSFPPSLQTHSLFLFWILFKNRLPPKSSMRNIELSFFSLWRRLLDVILGTEPPPERERKRKM